MRIFLTGATGFIGSRVTSELLKAGHEVLGLTRSDAGARTLEAAGASVHRGELTDLDGLTRGAAAADAVIHLAFDHDFSNFAANCEKDARAVGALSSGLKGSDRPLVVTSGVGMGSDGSGRPATEDVFDAANPHPRAASERACEAALQAGANVSVVRLPQVHDTRRQGLITPYVELSRDKGLTAYVGEGGNRWSAAHVDDVARLYVLAVERAGPGVRHNAVDEEGVPMRDIAEVVAEGLGVPAISLSAEDAGAHFGWLSIFAGLDMSATSAITRARLGWSPTGPGLISDLRRMDYSRPLAA
ncbi:SDR family oxidoreductase [Chenggangzhangella methanolivorans]|uniref:SDR family oxidoreductase n=1 Tax=Chenggangzhangella methanolivorans TaxID=1437009 RepID=A0A9E6RB04_9HYPH|nr:SDR family oxidoreductase [Chenggangzhangella methanolivorans]QZO00024.1 SDR family oxidoreductase [Chenggangzhangella methanolivorans]